MKNEVYLLGELNKVHLTFNSFAILYLFKHKHKQLFENNKIKLDKKDLCMECGACSKNCPVSAIEVKTGVGWAYAILRVMLTGSEPKC